MYIQKLVILILISLALLASGCEGIMNVKQSSEFLQEPSTDFYILGPDGTAKNYPTNYRVLPNQYQN